MNNIRLIVSELSKTKSEKITLPFSKKEVVIKKPSFKLIQDIQKKLEEINIDIEGNNSAKFQEAVLIYKQYSNQLCSQHTGTDVNLLDRNFYLFSLLDLFYKERKYEHIINNIKELNIPDTLFEENENELTFKMNLSIPSIQTDNKFISYLKSNTGAVGAFNSIDFNKFKYVNSFNINDDDNLSFTINDISIKNMYTIFSSLPIETTSKLFSTINDTFIKPVSEAQEDNDIENNPQLFIDINK